jgi:hypothetical protein
VYTVGIGTPGGETIGSEGWSMRVRLDEQALKTIANVTQGEYFYAGTATDLQKIYKNLNTKLFFEQRETEVSALFAAAAAVLALVSGLCPSSGSTGSFDLDRGIPVSAALTADVPLRRRDRVGRTSRNTQRTALIGMHVRIVRMGARDPFDKSMRAVTIDMELRRATRVASRLPRTWRSRRARAGIAPHRSCRGSDAVDMLSSH